MESLEKLFETYRGHDQTLSLIGYGSKMISGLYAEDSARRAAWATVSSQISNARVILRLLDDVAMFNTTLSYGLGKHEKNLLVRTLTIIDNLASHLYYLCEHVAWLADNKVLAIDSGIYWLVSLICWLISLLSSLICNFIAVRVLYKKLRSAKEASKPGAKVPLNKGLVLLYIRMMKDVFWLVNAVHWLPFKGFLWAGRLSNFWSGLLGVLAVTCNLITKICF